MERAYRGGQPPPGRIGANGSDLFPVVYSLLSPSALLSWAQRNYAIEPARSCHLLYVGVNDTYVLQADSGRYILRAYRSGWRSMSDIQAEIDVLQHLDSAGISVARPIESAGGEYIGGVRAPEGERALVLFEYVTGHKPRSGDPAEMRAFGRTLARIHDAGERFQPDHQRFSYDLSLILDEPCRHLEQTLSPRPARWSAFLSIVTWLRTSLRELPLATLRWGMCHGDFQPKNTRVSDDGRITVFDFDHCGAGWHAYDLGIVRLTLPEISWGWFIDGYSEARGLNQTDRDAIPLFAMANRIQSMGFYAAHRDTTLWGSDAMSDTYFDDCLSHLQREQADSICRNASVDVTHRQSPSSSDTRP